MSRFRQQDKMLGQSNNFLEVLEQISQIAPLNKPVLIIGERGTGKELVAARMLHRRDGVFHIALLDLNRGRLSVLTETSLDESPSVAPNGSMLIYATQQRGEGILAAVSIDGGVKFNLPSSDGDVREPAWSPVKRKTFVPVE